MKISGGCHCRAVRFEAETPQMVEILDCNCSICSMTGFRHMVVPHADFTLLSGREALATGSVRALPIISSAGFAE